MTQLPAIDDSERRARAARRTAWIAGLVAVAVYAAFMIAAVL